MRALGAERIKGSSKPILVWNIALAFTAIQQLLLVVLSFNNFFLACTGTYYCYCYCCSFARDMYGVRCVVVYLCILSVVVILRRKHVSLLFCFLTSSLRVQNWEFHIIMVVVGVRNLSHWA